MPRATGSKAGAILAFFKSAHLEVAEMVLGMAKDAINGRKALADKVRAGQVKAAKKEAKATKVVVHRRTRGPNKAKVAAAVEAPKLRRKRASRTRKMAAASEPALPMDTSDIDSEYIEQAEPVEA